MKKTYLMDTGYREKRVGILMSTKWLDNQPNRWLARAMEAIGIFEAKTKFPGICDEVVRSGSPVMVSRRGKPLVIISPVTQQAGPNQGGIADDWAAWEQAHPQSDDADFPEVWKLRHSREHHPFEQ
ncbi:MAG: hypothetical protein GVY36_07605 [Verrucomicrobia bacterium]|nr:hypothetical protein [Verrucomicrobiota bacterium]